VGSIIAQLIIGPLRGIGSTSANSSPWLNHVMQIFALFMLCGTFTTLLIPETKTKTLEQLAGEVPNTPEFQGVGYDGQQIVETVVNGNGKGKAM
jgi:MFS transporter, PHS family, inorganic phosphate transporter